MESAQEGHIELTKYLLQNGADVNAQSGTGDTALTYACENGHTDVSDLLLKYNAVLVSILDSIIIPENLSLNNCSAHIKSLLKANYY